MYTDRSKGSYQQRAIEFLARESQVPINEVAQLYEDERAGLAVGARITGFLPIFAIRNVRETLRRRSAGKRPSTLNPAAAQRVAPPVTAGPR
jgi:Protein of unknown function (DUF3562)